MRKFLKENSLYVIIDAGLIKNNFSRVCRQIISGGVDIIQLRCKHLPDKEFLKIAEKLRKITRYYQIPFIINDRVDIAIASNADGVHLGQDDLPLTIVRKFPGMSHKIIGISTHNLRQAKIAEKQGADYLGVGPIFPSLTKPDLKPQGTVLIRKVKKYLQVPVIAIGGINETNLGEVMQAGANGSAVITAVLTARNPALATRQLKNILTK